MNTSSHMKMHHTQHALVLIATLLLTTASTGCGPLEEPPEPAPLGQQEQAKESDNGLSFNGLSFNGLSFNGLSFNGLSFNGLSSSSFINWFEADPAMADLVMRYVVLCAVPAGESRTYTRQNASQTYTWHGGLGLATGWASGSQATEAEEQVVSACLGAHANRYGVQMPISVLGKGATGLIIPYTGTELSTYSRRESCFFGNLFRGDKKLYVATEREPLGASESTTRACGASLYGGTETSAPCAPMVHAGTCASHCTLNGTDGHYFVSCTYNGVTYKPITTRLRMQDINTCGDGVCQPTERCGATSSDYRHDSCGLDCGTCN